MKKIISRARSLFEHPVLKPCKAVVRFCYVRYVNRCKVPTVRQRYSASMRRIALNDKINVFFIVHERAKWGGQSVYENFASNPRFTVSVLIAPKRNQNTFDPDFRKLEEEYRFFVNQNMNVSRLYDPETKTLLPLERFSPDIVFYFQAGVPCQEHSVWNASKIALTCYIPYGIMAANIQQRQFNHPDHLHYWKLFCETPTHRELSKKYAANQGVNAVVSGYPKMDAFWEKKASEDASAWKIRRQDNPYIKRIIWAPHWSVGSAMQNAGLAYGTFHIYRARIMDFLKENTGIEILFKPHPALKNACIRTKIISEDEYDRFLDEWNALPNASYCDDGNYFGIFQSSDAMIHDSISFVSEYMFTGKPMQFLCRSPNILKTDFNEYGLEAARHMYEAHCWEDVERFVEDTVIRENDPMREARDDFVQKVLQWNQRPAGKFIVEHIMEELSI